MRRFTVPVLLALVAAVFVPGPSARADGAAALSFKGCSISRRAFMSEAATAYERATGNRITVMGGGATLGIRATAAGETDVGGTCRPPLPEMFEEERGLEVIHVAWDALAFVTQPGTTVDGLTLDQAKDILLGTITDWSQVGGRARPVVPVLRSQVPEHGGKRSGVGYMTRVMLFGDPETEFTQRALFFRHSAEVEEAVERITGAFAVTGVSSAKKRAVKVLALDGVLPEPEQVASGAYPLYRPLYLVIRKDAPAAVRHFAEWILGAEGQAVIAGEGTVNLEQGRRLEESFGHWPGEVRR